MCGEPDYNFCDGSIYFLNRRFDFGEYNLNFPNINFDSTEDSFYFRDCRFHFRDNDFDFGDVTFYYPDRNIGCADSDTGFLTSCTTFSQSACLCWNDCDWNTNNEFKLLNSYYQIINN
ncbi:MAG: hypothetical protein ABI855_13710 [Bacteroidota bacterium]